jgi:branched-chain amino acid transport system substrate-binding protein
MKRKLTAIAAAVLASAAGLAQAQISDGVIKIGVMNDMSGLYADIAGPGSVTAAKMAVEDFGAARKGMKVEVGGGEEKVGRSGASPPTHQNKPDVGSTIARTWYDVDKVDAIFDVPTSSVALAVNQITREKGKAFINSGAATSDLTGKACSPNTIHWTYDTWMLANGTGSAIVKTGGDSWFFLTADYAFGHALERDTEAAVVRGGGKVLGKVRHPFPGQDFSSFLLQAQSSKAKVIALANAGGDTINSIKQAAEFGITKGGQNLAGMLMFITDVHALGLNTAQGLIFTETFYWDLNDQTRAWSRKFAAANGGKYPSMVQAGVYASVLHYLKAVEAAKTDDGAKVVAQMKAMPTDDPLFGKGSIRADGRKLHPAYLVEVKKPAESKGPYDYYKVRATIPADQAFRPVNQGECPLVK